MEDDEQGITTEHKPVGYRDCGIHMICKLRRDLDLFNTNRKSIIPSLALWSHIQNLEFNFDGEDNELLSRFDRGLGMEDKMKIVQEILKDKRSVNLKVYDFWSEESKEFFLAEDHCGTKYDGNLVETRNGSTTIWISRCAFRFMTMHLWRRFCAFASIRKLSTDIYGLLNEPLTEKDELSTRELRSNRARRGGAFLDILVDMKNVMEPKYHPLIRKEQEETLKFFWAHHTKVGMLKFRPIWEFPFSSFEHYSAIVRELFRSKVHASKELCTTDKIVDIYWEFIQSPFEMEKKLQSGTYCDSDSLTEDSSRDILIQMCTESLQEFKMLETHFVKIKKFLNIMEELFEESATNEEWRGQLDSDIRRLRTLGLFPNAEKLEGNGECHSALQEIMERWFDDLSVDYALLGILLYVEGAELTGDKREEFIREKVKGSMTTRESYLYEIWYGSCREKKAYRDLDDPARVLSWSDNDAKFPMCELHEKLLSKLKLAEDDLKNMGELSSHEIFDHREPDELWETSNIPWPKVTGRYENDGRYVQPPKRFHRRTPDEIWGTSNIPW